MSLSVSQFYDEFSEDYHLIFPDWPQTVYRHGRILDNIIRSHLGAPPYSVLDCSCGIGTQAIGLALLGYKVHATDLSPRAVQRAGREAEMLGARLSFGVADFRTLETQVEGDFDVIISCDNSLPHLLDDEDLLTAAANIRSKLKDNGMLLATIRDYDQLVKEKPSSTPLNVIDGPEGRRLVFQVWDWEDGRNEYTINHFIVKESGGSWGTIHHATKYRALLRGELDEI